MSTRGGLTGGSQRTVVTTNCEKSAQVIVPLKDGKDRTIVSRSNGRKEVNMTKAENLENKGCPQKDGTECKEYAGAQSIDKRETVMSARKHTVKIIPTAAGVNLMK